MGETDQRVDRAREERGTASYSVQREMDLWDVTGEIDTTGGNGEVGREF